MKKAGIYGILLSMIKQQAKLKKQLQGTGSSGSPEAVEARESPMNLRKELLGLCCLLLALLLVSFGAVSVFIPRRTDYGATWSMYLKEPKDSIDVMFFGSSLAYCDAVPAVIYEESGITSYVMGGPEQTMPITYYYLREACRTQSPKVVLIEATSLLSEANKSVKINLTYMPWGLNRLIPTFQEDLTEPNRNPAVTKEKERDVRTGLLFPLYEYHSRWSDMSLQEFLEGFRGYETDPLAGYTYLDYAMPISEIETFDLSASKRTYAHNLECAGKIVAFCREQNIRPVFFLAPSVSRPSEELMEKLTSDIAGIGGEFINFNERFGNFGFDLSIDYFDTLHLNYRGAEKFSRTIAQMLSEQGVSPSETVDKDLWQKRVNHFSELREKANSQPIKLRSGKESENEF